LTVAFLKDMDIRLVKTGLIKNVVINTFATFSKHPPHFPINFKYNKFIHSSIPPNFLG